MIYSYTSETLFYFILFFFCTRLVIGKIYFPILSRLLFILGYTLFFGLNNTIIAPFLIFLVIFLNVYTSKYIGCVFLYIFKTPWATIMFTIIYLFLIEIYFKFTIV